MCSTPYSQAVCVSGPFLKDSAKYPFWHNIFTQQNFCTFCVNYIRTSNRISVKVWNIHCDFFLLSESQHFLVYLVRSPKVWNQPLCLTAQEWFKFLLKFYQEMLFLRQSFFTFCTKYLWIDRKKQVFVKHCKNCECCPCHSLFKCHNSNVDIVVLKCQKCNQCLKCQD